ncbi:MAG: hypothetical protein HOO91_09445 [Bacteroidales bacterium]|nr:hypothetical protein [Bacteroidales bacterium]
MDDQIKNAEESFQIIKDMIENEKVRFNENGFVYLFWGWLAIFCATLEYVLIFSEVQHHYYAWFTMLLGGVFMGFYFRNKKGRSSMPLTGKVISTLWISIGVNIFITAFLIPATFGHLLLFLILAMIGVGTTISGALIRFSWLTIGGIICNTLAFVTIFVPPIYWGAISIIAIIFADLIPGYMLRVKYRNHHV